MDQPFVRDCRTAGAGPPKARHFAEVGQALVRNGGVVEHEILEAAESLEVSKPRVPDRSVVKQGPRACPLAQLDASSPIGYPGPAHVEN